MTGGANPGPRASRGAHGQLKAEKLIFERSRPGRVGYSLPALDVPAVDAHAAWGSEHVREDLVGFPEVSEVDVVRHFTRISQHNYGIDVGLHPLGSCTMKYNPKFNERLARLTGFGAAHPYMPDELMQGGLELMWRLERLLSEISGLPHVSLQPAAGAQGELTGIMLIAAYHRSRGDSSRGKVLIPDSAHGTNPATASLCGLIPIEIPSNAAGTIDVDGLQAAVDEETAALMLTNPNTLGLFERDIDEISRIVHDAGALIYCDGANLNAIMGKTRPGDFGADVFHINLHKTFTTPHGGGGPGCGPVAVVERLEPFLPRPVIVRQNEGGFRFEHDRPRSIGKIHAFHGNFAMMVRAYAYIRALGAEGVRQVSEDAVLAANYLKERLRGHYELPHDTTCMHEVVFSDELQKKLGVSAMDICKRLMDYGFHPPTVYFPLVVHGALMIEPTETVSLQEIDEFADALIAIAREAQQEPETVTTAPHSTYHRRLDEVLAARHPVLRWDPACTGEETGGDPVGS